MRALFDPGLQPERTLLSWRRTCLALGAIGATAARFTAEAAPAVAIVIGLAGVGLAAVSYLAATRRYRSVYRRREGPTGPLGDARALWSLTAAVVVVGAGCGVYVVEGAWTQ
ncbi:DUF202 domain-containing protein [Glycomyces tenuis]|uniref:DUF202 domain-containing protein n=1 Tax=Glycomyces tenuis TaxID=58116 RepID=UPI00040BE46E|nr:DUF202 domain-containing protein [Glycomyces tenuis]